MTRTRLAARRESRLGDFTFGDRNDLWSVGWSLDVDGAVAEIFISPAKGAGSGIEAVARDAAIIASIALQHGSTIEELASSLTRDSRGEAATVAGRAIDCVLYAVRKEERM